MLTICDQYRAQAQPPNHLVHLTSVSTLSQAKALYGSLRIEHDDPSTEFSAAQTEVRNATLSFKDERGGKSEVKLTLVLNEQQQYLLTCIV